MAFDLDTDAMKIYYPSESWNNGYDVIRRHMANNGFDWLQGSVYISQKPITSAEVTDILDELVSKNPWLNICMRDCRESNIGREHSKNHLFNKEAKVPTREELKAKERENKQDTMKGWMDGIAKRKAEAGEKPKQQSLTHKNEKDKTDR